MPRWLRSLFSRSVRSTPHLGHADQRGVQASRCFPLALVLVMQALEGLADRQTADAVRSRIDGKYARTHALADPGFDASILSAFRLCLILGEVEIQLLDTLLTLCCTSAACSRSAASNAPPPRRSSSQCAPSTDAHWSSRRYATRSTAWQGSPQTGGSRRIFPHGRARYALCAERAAFPKTIPNVRR